MDNKYELIPSDKEGLYRIKALKDFGNVKKGDIGGYIQTENNLSQLGDCWIYDNVVICDNARVEDNAQVYGNAKICGNAIVFDYAKVWGNAIVRDNAAVRGEVRIFDNVIVRDNVIIGGEADICGDAIISSDKDYIVFKNWWRKFI